MIDHTLLKKGNIIAFPYLWKWQAGRGETEGRKEVPSQTFCSSDGVIGLV